MNQSATALQKNPPLEPAEDFYRLRREGIGFIEQMGSARWTDYNTHDPGITTLEALCYAITDLAYRTGWDIKDILSPAAASPDPSQPYPNQAFFTARDILTINPATADDFRRLLIDLEKVRNAWVTCKECACDASYFAWCDVVKDELLLDYEKPADVQPAAQKVWAHGLYEAMLELEADPELGDLNDRKIEYQSIFRDSDGAHPIIMEMRFPDVSRLNRDQWQLFLDSDSAFTAKLTRLGATKTFNVFGANDKSDVLKEQDRDNYIRDHWRNIFYLSLDIQSGSSGGPIAIENATLRIFSDTAAKMATTAASLKTLLEDPASAFVQRYREKAKRAREAVKSAKAALQAHRNLDEDYCTVKIVGIEEVAVCADVEVRPDADIEWVQAQIWFKIEQYFNPPIRFFTLRELRDAGEAIEEIFNGPALDSGFIKPDDLTAASLKSELRVSDIVNLLMDIDGVIAVNQLLLTKYDAEGNAVAGAADPSWDAITEQPVFDVNRTSASWLLFISSQHQPRLYLNLSRFLFYKNGLPFQPRMDEADDTFNQLRGEAERPKNSDAEGDLRIPKGTFRSPQDYYPIQYSFPQTYGIGPSGLPSHASEQRIASAKQLKAYLMVFEQVLGNSLANLAHTADLFSLDPSIKQTYFVKLFDEPQIKGFGDIKQTGMTKPALEALAETTPEFYERRNRFLDHLLARFGEQFSEYALLLSNAAGEQVAQQRLIEDKTSFLRRYPLISHDRARAFDYALAPCSPDNISGIKKRISLLLGYPDLTFVWTVTDQGGGSYAVLFQLVDGNGRHWLDGGLTLPASSQAQAKQAAYRTVIERMILPEAYDTAPENGKFPVKLKSKTGIVLCKCPDPFATAADAATMQDELLAWSANERLIVVEHLLLRPKFLGDALFPACCNGACGICGDEDPYSFRLTFVMPGWTAQYTDNLDLRRFAERTIQYETPSHLLGKTCWVGNDGIVENLCDQVIDDVAGLLLAKGLTAGGTPPSEADACACATNLYHAFRTAFLAWYEDKALDYFHPDALGTLIGATFKTAVKPADVTCTTVLDASLWDAVLAAMTKRFVEIALNGFQFERFEAAWCRWLTANAMIDWTEERLLDRVQAILQHGLTSGPVEASALCQCAKAILTKHGAKFHAWIDGGLKAGLALTDFPAFKAPDIDLCPGMDFNKDTAARIAAFLKDRYDAYRQVSYRLWIVVNLLSSLSNTYPGATLHDCDDGSDHNPVRLDNTALGNYPLRTTLT